MDEKAKHQLNLLRCRSEHLKDITRERIKEENDFIGIRLVQKYKHFNNLIHIFRGVSTMRTKDLKDSFQNNMNYKKFSNKFELPQIKDKVPLILGRKMDITLYDRVI